MLHLIARYIVWINLCFTSFPYWQNHGTVLTVNMHKFPVDILNLKRTSFVSYLFSWNISYASVLHDNIEGLFHISRIYAFEMHHVTFDYLYKKKFLSVYIGLVKSHLLVKILNSISMSLFFFLYIILMCMFSVRYITFFRERARLYHYDDTL